MFACAYTPVTTVASHSTAPANSSAILQHNNCDFIKIHLNDTLIYLSNIFVIAAAGNLLKAFKQ